jgi:hypothetical protein
MPEQEFIVILCMVQWIGVTFGDSYRVIELFAGVARITKACLFYGYKAVAIDIEFDQAKPSTMDFNSSPGYVLLGLSNLLFLFCMHLGGLNNSCNIDVMYATLVVCCIARLARGTAKFDWMTSR